MLTITESLTDIWPWLLIGFLAALIWLLICRALLRRRDDAWRALLPVAEPVDDTQSYAVQLKSYELKLATLRARIKMVRRGSPSDRFFVYSLLTLPLMCFAYIAIMAALAS